VGNKLWTASIISFVECIMNVLINDLLLPAAGLTLSVSSSN